jgi:hypothetical protein
VKELQKNETFAFAPPYSKRDPVWQLKLRTHAAILIKQLRKKNQAIFFVSPKNG